MSSRTPAGPGRPAALLAVRVAHADVGRRVTVRRRTEDGRLSDVVGVLEAWTPDGLLSVRRRDGQAVAVREHDVVAAKVVAPELSAGAMQKVAQAGWPPFETASLGDWELRASDGVTGRANSVRVDGDPGVPLDEALARITAWYADRGVVPALQVPVPSRWDSALEDRGWAVARRTVLRTATTADVLAAAGDPPTGWTAHRTDDPSAELLALVEPDLPPLPLTRILTAPAEHVHVEVRGADGSLAAAGRASAAPSPAGRWAGVTSIYVAEDVRGRGLARLVMGELARWSLEHDCPRTYLQALEGNTAARSLYDGLGFLTHHAYVYRSPGGLSAR